MKKIFSFFVALMATTMMFAQEAKVTFVAPFAYTNDMYIDDVYEMAYVLQQDYRAMYNGTWTWAKMENGQVYFKIGDAWKTPAESKGIDAVEHYLWTASYSATDNFKKLIQTPKWQWMETAIIAQRTASGKSVAEADMKDNVYRKEVCAMFMASPSSTTKWVDCADWTKFDAEAMLKAWGGIIALPTAITEEYTLPTMYRENYTFKGWYTNAEGTGTAVTKLDATSTGTYYAVFEATEKALKSIALSKTGTVDLQMPNTDQLTVTFTPETAANKNVTWSSSDENILIVDQTGLVTPKAPGKATVKVVSEESKLEASVEYNITAAAGAVTGVSLNKTTLTLALGTTEQLIATIAPEDATNKKVTWTSDSKAASVTEDGTVKADTVGTATITVTTEDGGYTATCVVTVPEPLDNIKVEKVWEVAIPTEVAATTDVRCGMGWNGKFYLTDKNQNKVRVFTSKGEDEDAAIPMAEGAKLGTGIAIDDAGNILLAANFPGKDTCVFIVKNGEKTMTKVDFHLPMEGRADMFTAFGDIFSEKGGLVFFHGAGVTQVQYVKIAKGALVEVKQMEGIVTAGTTVSCIPYGTETEAWVNVRSAAMQYVKDGVVTTIAPKNVKTSTTGGAVMFIGGNEVWSYNVGTTNYSTEFSIRNMTTQQFVADENGNTVQYYIDNKAATNSTYANFTKAEKIDDYAYYLNVFTSGKGAAVYKVYQEVPVTGVEVTPATATLKAGETLQLTATITPAEATVKNVTWTTSDADVAIVSADGLVKAIAAGNATITATTEDGNLTAVCNLTVKPISFKKALAANELVAGKKMLIVNADENRTLGQSAKNNFPEVAIEPVNHILTTVPAEATIITLMQDNGVYTFAVDGGYITATTASSNYMRIAEEQSTLTQWNITLGENGVATIVCADSKSKRNTIRYNADAKLFSAYKGDAENDVVIYIERDDQGTDVENTVLEGAETIQKVIIDGNLYIIRGEHMYDATGAVVR